MDWQSRLDELNLFLRSTYQIEDTEAVAILASALVPCPRIQPVWLVLETNWFSRQCESYSAALQTILCDVAHNTERHANNRAEASHQPTRQRETPDAPI
jgi:hypothetical protein